MAAKRKSANKFSDLALLVVVGAVVYYVYGSRLPPLNWGLIALFVLLFWISFLMPTYCDYAIRSGGYCRNWVRGKLRGCRHHRRDKRDAVFALFGARNPGRAVRTVWGPNTAAGPPQRLAAPAEPTPQKPGDAVMLIATVVSAIAAVAALF